MVTRPKYYCPEHDWAAKGPCPQQHTEGGGTRIITPQWRPGKKGTRDRLWSQRQVQQRLTARRMSGRWTVPQFWSIPIPYVLQNLGARDPQADWPRHELFRSVREDPVAAGIRRRAARGRMRKRRNRVDK